MGDNVVLNVDRLETPTTLQSVQEDETVKVTGEGSSSSNTALSKGDKNEAVELEVSDEEQPLLQTVECRICQEEDNIKNLETPCACSGSLKVLHSNNVKLHFV